MRDDGRTVYHATFDPDTGRCRTRKNDLAYSDQTCWARGHGWNVAGLTRGYNETGAERYLDALEKTVDYYLEHSPDDLVSYWDLQAPDIPDAPRDTSAAALGAFGLSRHRGSNARAREPRATGHCILDSILSNYTVLDESDDRTE